MFQQKITKEQTTCPDYWNPPKTHQIICAPSRLISVHLKSSGSSQKMRINLIMTFWVSLIGHQCASQDIEYCALIRALESKKLPRPSPHNQIYNALSRFLTSLVSTSHWLGKFWFWGETKFWYLFKTGNLYFPSFMNIIPWGIKCATLPDKLYIGQLWKMILFNCLSHTNLSTQQKGKITPPPPCLEGNLCRFEANRFFKYEFFFL